MLSIYKTTRCTKIKQLGPFSDIHLLLVHYNWWLGSEWAFLLKFGRYVRTSHIASEDLLEKPKNLETERLVHAVTN